MSSKQAVVQKTITCHTCGEAVPLVRSVRLRQWIGAHSGPVKTRPGDGPACFVLGKNLRTGEVRRFEHFTHDKDGIEGLDVDVESLLMTGGPEAQLQYTRQMEYRRAFVCCACYLAMDDDASGGGCVIRRGGVRRLFFLSGDSRRGKAAVYNYGKWTAFQSRLAGGFGIDLGR